MTNTIIDLIRIPTDKNGNLLYDLDEARVILEVYHKALPDRVAMLMPDNISVWENLDIQTLKYYYNFLGDIIKKKENNI